MQVRVSPESLAVRVAALAESERRSVSATVSLLVEEALAARHPARSSGEVLRSSARPIAPQVIERAESDPGLAPSGKRSVTPDPRKR